MYKYQFSLNFNFIGKPFPAKSLEDATEIILDRHFKGYTPKIETRYDLEITTITIPIPGRKKLMYIVEKNRT